MKPFKYNIDFNMYKVFYAVAEYESFSKAAEKLHITQPTLSRQIADLEEELGVTLLTRTTRTITLTEEGEFLRKRAEEICRRKYEKARYSVT